VLATAFSAFDKDFDVVFVKDAVASWGGRLQNETCEIVELLLGAVVVAADVRFAGS
jgi:nicotinamidase-related amidase